MRLEDTCTDSSGPRPLGFDTRLLRGVLSTLVDVIGRIRFARGAARGAFWRRHRPRTEAAEAVVASPFRFADGDPPADEDLDALDAQLARDPGTPAPDFAPLDAELARLRRSSRARARRGRGKPAA